MKSMFAVISIAAILSYSVPTLAAGDAAAGKDPYLKKCASCHGQAGEGKESVAKNLKVELKHLGSKEVQAKNDGDLKKSIVEGVGKMKPPKDLDPASVDDIIAYLRTLAKK